jgi:HEAT repeat protein
METPSDRGAPTLPPAARRRRAVLAGHEGDRQVAAELLRDPDPAVRSAALGALDRLGVLDAGHLLGALGDGDPLVRRRACTLVGRAPHRLRTEAVVDAVVEATDDGDPAVAEAAAWALGELGPQADQRVVDALSRLLGHHRAPGCREAAVAALGAIGAPSSLAAVLSALDDGPAIRRRTAVALAAFDDPRADEGLRRCLADRDWQVRQAAEDLLASD